jgi:hypothetical protein
MISLKRTIALGAIAAIAVSVATPTLAKTSYRGGVGEYVYQPGDGRCSTDEGYGRRGACDGAAF